MVFVLLILLTLPAKADALLDAIMSYVPRSQPEQVQYDDAEIDWGDCEPKHFSWDDVYLESNGPDVDADPYEDIDYGEIEVYEYP